MMNFWKTVLAVIVALLILTLAGIGASLLISTSQAQNRDHPTVGTTFTPDP